MTADQVSEETPRSVSQRVVSVLTLRNSRYPEDTVRRVRFIKRAQDLGLSLKEIKELLVLRTQPGAKSAAVRERASAKLIDIDEKIRSLQAIRKTLSKLIDSCSGCGPVETCSILESLDTWCSVK